MKTAIVLGATGLTGGVLLEKLLQDDRYSSIKLFSRTSVGMNHPKIKEHLLDLLELERYKELFTGDDVFVCIGSTKKKTPNEEVYRKIDYGIPVSAARLASENGVDSFLVISALGANAESNFFYNRTKGEMERDVLKEKYSNTYIFQPSLIGGERKETRFFESLGKEMMKVGNHLLRGRLKKYRSINPETIAEAMIFVANAGYAKKKIPSDEIKLIAKKASQEQK